MIPDNLFTIFAEIAGMVKALELKAIAKQITATIQILSGLGPVLAVAFPKFFNGFLGRIASWFKIDLSILFGVGCYAVNSYALSLFINFATVGVLVMVIGIVHSFQFRQLVHHALHGEDSPEEVRASTLAVYEKFDRDGDGISLDEVKQIVMQIDPTVSDESVKVLFDNADTHNSGLIDFEEFLAAVNSPHTDDFSLDDLVLQKRKFDLKAETLGRLFLLVFVMYPGLTNKVFEGFMCRDLGDMAVLNTDYTTVCYTSEWYMIASVCGVLVLLWPIGLPAVLFFSMRRVLPLIKAGDEDTLKFWDFALGDYSTDHWYWEVVELSRKLIMAGLLGLLGRGSIIQVFAATLISFFFFAFALKALPFESSRLNFIKVFSEFQLFVILLSCLVLQTDERGLMGQAIFGREHIGMMQAVVTMASLPVVVYLVGDHVVGVAKEDKEEATRRRSSITP